jgi:hypothetical protein
MRRASQVMMKDVGVLIMGFSRPELLKKRIEEVSSQNVVNLYISIDGGVKSHTVEMEEIKLFAKLSRPEDCNLHLIHHENLLGMTRHFSTAISNVLLNHEFVVVIEDDVKLSENFVNNLIQGLNLLALSNTLGIVCSFSPLNHRAGKNYWRILATPYLYAWGWACSREVWKTYKSDLSKIDIVRELENSVGWPKLSILQKKNWIRRFNKVKVNPDFTWDYQLLFNAVVNNYTVLGPLFSFSGNEGFLDQRATHTLDAPPRYLDNFRLNNSLVTKQLSFPALKYLEKYTYGDNYMPFRKSLAPIKSKLSALILRFKSY